MRKLTLFFAILISTIICFLFVGFTPVVNAEEEKPVNPYPYNPRSQQLNIDNNFTSWSLDTLELLVRPFVFLDFDTFNNSVAIKKVGAYVSRWVLSSSGSYFTTSLISYNIPENEIYYIKYTEATTTLTQEELNAIKITSDIAIETDSTATGVTGAYLDFYFTFNTKYDTTKSDIERPKELGFTYIKMNAGDYGIRFINNEVTQDISTTDFYSYSLWEIGALSNQNYYYKFGYDVGVKQGEANIQPVTSVFDFFNVIARGFSNIMSVEILPGIKIGYIIGIPIILGLLKFFLGLFR